MLRGLRKASANWLGKVVMAAVVGFLIISFAIWGIGDIFRGATRTTVAKVGNTEISGEQFRSLFNERLQQFSRQVGRPITPAQAQAFGLDQQFLSQLLAESALDEQARALRLGVTDSEIARRIVQDPSFRGLSGQFDQARFEQLIRQLGYNEQRYVAEQKRMATRRQITGSVINGTIVPNTAVEAFSRFEFEQRSADYVALGKAVAGDIPAPSAETLAKYFEDRKSLFRAPEYRKLILLTLTPEEVGRSIEVSDADAQRVFEERKARYTTPERREVQQIVFPNEEEARAAAAKLASGTSFDALAAERGLKPADYNLGLVTKSGIIDPAVAEAAFAFKQDAVSEPVKGRFGVALVRVIKIEPSHASTFAEVEADIKRDIAQERAKADVTAQRDKIEDELAAGSRLDEAAQKLKIPVRTIAAVDRSGRGPDGNPVEGLPKGVDVLPAVFSAQVGVENDPLQVGGGFVWYEVAGVTPSSDRTLDEVKDRVEARWRDDEIAARLKTKADEMVEKLKAGTSLADLAAAAGLKVESVSGLKRAGTQALPSQVVAAIFKTPKGAPGTAEGQEPSERIVFLVTDVNVPAFSRTSPDAKKIGDTLRDLLSNELFSQYVTRLETELGTSVNQAAVAQALGTATRN